MIPSFSSAHDSNIRKGRPIGFGTNRNISQSSIHNTSGKTESLHKSTSSFQDRIMNFRTGLAGFLGFVSD